jgi:RES domain-containing protein
MAPSTRADSRLARRTLLSHGGNSIPGPVETNYLLNPLHADFRRIRIGKPQKFATDLRLIKT